MFNISTSTECGPELHDTVYAVVFGCVVVLGLPLNALSLWTLLRRHRLKSPSAVFMVNLALSDLFLVISLPMRVYFYATRSWPLGIAACTSLTMLFRNNIRSSSIFITFIGVDRLLAVVYPLRLRHLRSTSNAWRACCFVWFFLVVVNVPEGIDFSRSMHRCNSTTCFVPGPGCRDNIRAMALLQSGLVFTMLAVNVVSTALVSWTLRRRLSDSAKVNNKVNAVLIFAMNLLMFIICFVPLSLAMMLKCAVMPALCLASVNCCLDPLLYYFSLDAFWKKKEDGGSLLRKEEQVRTMSLKTSN